MGELRLLSREAGGSSENVRAGRTLGHHQVNPRHLTVKTLRPREGEPGLSQGPQKFLGDRTAERISPVPSQGH